MYVTLEPCCHHGKTPPCTDAIIAVGLKKVVVAAIDPSSHANGRGVEQLRQAGIDVEIGICRTEALLLNAPFIKFASTGKSWVTLKWAQTIDGKLAWKAAAGDKRWISNELCRKDAHKLRRVAQAVLVGINTVLADDPLLTPRPSGGKKPLRIVLDSRLRTPPGCRLLATAKKSPVLILTSAHAVQENPQAARTLQDTGAELLVFPDTSGESNLSFLLAQLADRGISHLLVEGGPTVIASFLAEGLADELCVYIAPGLLGASGDIDIALPLARLNQSVNLHHVNIRRFGDDVCIRGLTRSLD
jgi:diaminohydroxyphosphoribosylaminopyrimidine deaminase/5-amino-6-(5-phosphoribosylamino)uracil reductase